MGKKRGAERKHVKYSRFYKKNKDDIPKKYLTTTQAMGKLGVNHGCFKRLCILKGVYPQSLEQKHQRYIKIIDENESIYSKEDIASISNDDIVSQILKEKKTIKRIRKLTMLRDFKGAKNVEESFSGVKLDSVVKERYPDFLDALNDLDDPLCHIALFSRISLENINDKVDTKHLGILYSEFLSYIVESRALKKVFLSVKGIYYQVEVRGQTITWMHPYDFGQCVSGSVDMEIMWYSLEFYENLLRFVNTKLFLDSKLIYPPEVDQRNLDMGLDVPSIILRRMNDDVSGPVIPECESNAEVLGRVHSIPDIINSSVDVEQECVTLDIKHGNETTDSFGGVGLFDGMVFFVSRETPRNSLIFVIKSMGGKVGWDYETSLYKEEDLAITHQIVDRPFIKDLYQNRIYVQPQWVYDCLNSKTVLDPGAYLVGKNLPPHLSPFIDNSAIDSEVEENMQNKLKTSLMSKSRKKLYETMKRNRKVQHKQSVL